MNLTWHVTHRTNQQYAEDYSAKYNEEPTYQGMSAQMNMLALVEAMEAAQSTDKLLVSAQLRVMNMQTIFGTLSFDENGQGRILSKVYKWLRYPRVALLISGLSPLDVQPPQA